MIPAAEQAKVALELDEKRTPGEWHYERINVGYANETGEVTAPTYRAGDASLRTPIACEATLPADGEFIAFAANNLRLLAEAVLRMDKVYNAALFLRDEDECDAMNGGGIHPTTITRGPLVALYDAVDEATGRVLDTKETP